MKKQLEASLRQGVSFLSKKQHLSGEFSTRVWEKFKINDSSYVKTLFPTSFVLHSLKHVEKYVQVEKIVQRAAKFLLGEMEENGLWRFYGKKSYIHFDLDTTCCILASLKEWCVDLDFEVLSFNLLKYRNAKSIFDTWILDVYPPFEKKDNNVDWVVNANVLFFYSLLDLCLPEVEQYLNRVVETETFKQRSPYYDSPFCFIYCLTRAYADGRNPKLSPAIAKIKNYLLSFKEENKLHDDVLESALATVGILNCGGDVTEASPAIEYLLSMQKNDGGWPMGIFFTGGPYTEYRIVYGSEELTTAIALEAISKYVRKHRGRITR